MPLGPTARYLLRPLAAPPLLFVAVVAPLLWAASAAGFLGVPLLLILGSWICTYAYLLVDYTARGLPPPVLAIEMLNPWHEPRPLLQLALLLAAASLGWWLDHHGARPAAIGVVVAAIGLFPASLAVLAVEGHLARAVWPPALLRIALRLGVRYLGVLALAIAAAWLCLAAAPYLPRLLLLALGQLAAFSVATTLGGALYERRAELGLEAWDTPEQRIVAAATAAERARQLIVDEVYGLLRARELGLAWDRLQAGLGTPPVDPDRYRWFRDHAAHWEDRRIADRLNDMLVARLLALGRRGEALLEVENWWRRGGQYQPCTPRDLDMLKSVAVELGHAAVHERLAAGQAAGSPHVDISSQTGRR